MIGPLAVASMVHHVVLFRFRADLAEGEVASLFEALRALRQAIPGISGFQGGLTTPPRGCRRASPTGSR